MVLHRTGSCVRISSNAESLIWRAEAIEILDGSMETRLIKIGNQEGGICSDFGISEEEYLIRWECLRHSLQAVAETAECNVFLNYYTIAAVGNTSLELFKASSCQW